jgi:uncharacterized membrane protein YhaH (DUF805 family)
MNWFVTALKSYAVFSGRSRRSEYWYFALFYLIFYVVAAIVDVMAGSFDRASGIGIFWWLLIALIPVVGAIILLVFLAQDSEAGANRFGANPKAGSMGRSFQVAAPGKPWSAPQAKR